MTDGLKQSVLSVATDPKTGLSVSAATFFASFADWVPIIATLCGICYTVVLIFHTILKERRERRYMELKIQEMERRSVPREES